MDADGKFGLRVAPNELLAQARERTLGYPRALETLQGILAADRSTTLQELLAEAECVLQRPTTRPCCRYLSRISMVRRLRSSATELSPIHQMNHLRTL